MSHDIVETGDAHVLCGCGRRFDRSTLDAAKAAHRVHFELEGVRASLKKKDR